MDPPASLAACRARARARAAAGPDGRVYARVPELHRQLGLRGGGRRPGVHDDFSGRPAIRPSCRACTVVTGSLQATIVIQHLLGLATAALAVRHDAAARAAALGRARPRRRGRAHPRDGVDPEHTLLSEWLLLLLLAGAPCSPSAAPAEQPRGGGARARGPAAPARRRCSDWPVGARQRPVRDPRPGAGAAASARPLAGLRGSSPRSRRRRRSGVLLGYAAAPTTRRAPWASPPATAGCSTRAPLRSPTARPSPRRPGTRGPVRDLRRAHPRRARLLLLAQRAHPRSALPAGPTRRPCRALGSLDARRSSDSPARTSAPSPRDLWRYVFPVAARGRPGLEGPPASARPPRHACRWRRSSTASGRPALRLYPRSGCAARRRRSRLCTPSSGSAAS